MLQSRHNRPVDTQFEDPALNRVIDDIYRLIAKVQKTAEAAHSVTTGARPAGTGGSSGGSSGGGGGASSLAVSDLDATTTQGVLRGQGAQVFGYSEHADLENIGANDHHNQAHEIFDTDDHSDATYIREEYLDDDLAEGQVLAYDATNVIWRNRFPQVGNVTIVTTTYTVLATDTTVICNSSTAFTVTLPAATGSGKFYRIKNIGAGAVTVDGDESDTIDGETSQVLYQYEGVLLVDSEANEWVVV